MARWHGAKDKAHPEIRQVLEAHGASVQALDLTDGPDLLVGYRGRNYLLEVKTPARMEWSKRRGKKNAGEAFQRLRPAGELRPGQERWIAAWRGGVAVVHTPEEALAVVLGAFVAKGGERPLPPGGLEAGDPELLTFADRLDVAAGRLGRASSRAVRLSPAHIPPAARTDSVRAASGELCGTCVRGGRGGHGGVRGECPCACHVRFSP